jgi:hypothetical protein
VIATPMSALVGPIRTSFRLIPPQFAKGASQEFGAEPKSTVPAGARRGRTMLDALDAGHMIDRIIRSSPSHRRPRMPADTPTRPHRICTRKASIGLWRDRVILNSVPALPRKLEAPGFLSTVYVLMYTLAPELAF